MTDHTLKKLFNELKKEDSENTPNFQCMIRKQASTSDDPQTFGWMSYALVVALVLAAALLAFSVLPKNESDTATEVEQWAAITDWKASSDAILAENIPSIGGSLSTSSDMLFESSSVSSVPNKNQKL